LLIGHNRPEIRVGHNRLETRQRVLFFNSSAI
jgi:hypothetical protein